MMKELLAFLLVLLVYAISPLGHYGIPVKSSYISCETSPSGKYRVEFYHPRSCPYACFTYHEPFFIKVYDMKAKCYVYTSDIDEVAAIFSRITWPEEDNGFLTVSHDIFKIATKIFQ